VPKKQASPVDVQVGNRVRMRRMLIGMSQEKLGELLGLTFQQVQKYEKGVNRIGAGRLFEIASILGMPIQDFFDGLTSLLPQSKSHGFAEPDESGSVMEFMSSGEGLQLSAAFMKIKDPKTRKSVLDLIKNMSKDEDEKK
jgi:transcriptional regulator with XRE-family HTH domain